MYCCLLDGWFGMMWHFLARVVLVAALMVYDIIAFLNRVVLMETAFVYTMALCTIIDRPLAATLLS